MKNNPFNIETNNKSRNPFEVPDGYFDNLSSQINNSKFVKRRLPITELFRYAAAVAAIVATIGISLLLLDNNKQEINNAGLALTEFETEWLYFFELYDITENDIIELTLNADMHTYGISENEIFEFMSGDDDYYELFY